MGYWDTSALVKLYAAESDSEYFESHAVASSATPIVAEITRLELWVALRRKEKEGFILAGQARIYLNRFDQDVASGELQVVELSPRVADEFEAFTEKCFSQDPPLLVRTFDMLHLASAQVAGVSEFVTTDKRLREGASLMGFILFPPSSPPFTTP